MGKVYGSWKKLKRKGRYNVVLYSEKSLMLMSPLFII